MAVAEAVINGSSEVLPGVFTDIVVEVGKIGNWLQALGLIVILWIVFQVIALIVNRKNRKRIKAMRARIQEMDKKLDKIIRQLNKNNIKKK
jgi:ATP phosphoribosyltransferase